MREVTIAEALKEAIDRLSRAGVDNPIFDARLLLRFATKLDLIKLIVDSGAVLPEENWQQFKTLIDRRVSREPASHLIGEREFWSLPFIVSSDVLDPRPASETLIYATLDYVDDYSKKKTVLDLGTGTGCLLISVLSELPSAIGVGVDTSEAALIIAQQNAVKNSVDSRSAFFSSFWGSNIEGAFDLIISNPPYIAKHERGDLAPEVACYEPESALFAGEDGLSAYHAIAPDIYRLLNPDGITVIECGEGQMPSVVKIFGQVGLELVDSRYDIANIERCGIFRRSKALNQIKKKGWKAGKTPLL